MKRLTIKIYGQVQGVGFRYQARETANKLGIHGWIKNSSDGSVEAVLEGEENNLKEFINWCYNTDKFQGIKKTKESWEGATGEFKTFEILTHESNST